MNTQILEEAGFTQGEIKVYLALLELGETTTGPIIKHSNITGSKVYEILTRLIEKGMVSSVTKERTKYFQPSPPSRLLDYIDNKEAIIKQQKEEIRQLLPQLEAKVDATKSAQSAQVYEGWQGIRTVFSLILKETGKGGLYRVFSVGNELNDPRVVTFLKGHHERRVAAGVKLNLILLPSDKPIVLKDWQKYRGMEIRFYNYPLPLGIYIFGDYVATVSFKKGVAFLVKSQYVAQSYMQFFDDIWRKSKD